MPDTLYLVTFDGYYGKYGSEIYCGGIFDTKAKAEEYIRNDANLSEDNCLISELYLNVGLKTNDMGYETIGTDIYLGGYCEQYMTLKEFIKTYCDICGTQRCDPKDPIWREGCPHYQENKPLLDKEQNE